MKKKVLLTRPYLWIPSTILVVGFLSPVVYITIEHLSRGLLYMLIPAVPLLISSILSFLGLIYSLRKIEIFEDKVLEKDLFGNIINHCFINEITEISVITHIKAGKFFVIKDGRSSKNYNAQPFKYIYLQKTKKSSEIIRNLWRGEIKHYNI